MHARVRIALCVYIDLRPHSHVGDVSLTGDQGVIFNAGEGLPPRRLFCPRLFIRPYGF